MSQTQAKIDRALAVNSDALHERWLMNHSLIALVTDAHNLQEFSIVRCSHTGKPLGHHSATYLAELQRTLGAEQARFALKLAAVRNRQCFTAVNVAGETLSELLMNEPIAFFMHALAEYGGWYKADESSNVVEQTERAWRIIQQRATVYDAIHAGLASDTSDSLHMRSLLHACELLRRYLAIAYKHKQRDALEYIVRILAQEPVTVDATMQDVIALLTRTISDLITHVRDKRKEIRSATNLISEVRDRYGVGGGIWRQQAKSDRYYSNDEASRVLLEALDIDILPELSALDALLTKNAIMRDKEARKQQRNEPQYEGKTLLSTAAVAITIKWS